MRGLLPLVALMAPATAFGGALDGLFKVVDGYVRASSYAGQFEIEVTKVEAGRIRTWRVKGEMAYLAPNKFLLRMEDAIGGFVVACDGSRVISYLWPHMEYRVDPAPKSLKEFRADPLLGLPGRAPLVWQFLCAKDSKAVLGDVKSVGERTENGLKIFEARTELKGKEGKAFGRFSIKVRGGLIKEIVAELSVVDAKGRIVAYIIREAHLRAQIGGKVEEGKFRFQPPKGARKVERFSFPYP